MKRETDSMGVPSIAWGRWQALPFPAKLALGFLAFMAVIWLRDWLGSASVLLALLLWSAAGIGVLYASGGLTWADRHPQLTRVLDSFAPRQTFRPPTPMEARAVPPAPSRPPSGPATGAVPTPATPDLSNFVGLETVFEDVQRLVATRASWVSTVAPATLVLLVGPRGTGKTSVALALSAELRRVGGLRSDRIVVVSAGEVSALGSSRGSTEAGLTSVKERIQTALDGTLLIDDFDAVVRSPEAPVMTEIGLRVLDVARLHPGRLFVLATGSKEAAGRLDPGNRWLGRLNVRRIEFSPLSADALERLFIHLLSAKNLRLASNADRALKIQIDERRTQSGPDFDNAYAIGRLVDDVVQSQALRLHGDRALSGDATRIVTADDIRNAIPSL